MTGPSQRRCDYCEKRLDEDDELYPVYIGEPDVAPIREKETVTDNTDVPLWFQDEQLLGKEVGELLALLKALEQIDCVEVSTYARVQEFGETLVTASRKSDLVEEMQDELGSMSMPVGSATSVERSRQDINEGMSAAEITIEPEIETGAPDMEVCDFCHDELNSYPLHDN